MSLLTRRTVILAAEESSYGQDAAPTSSDGILCNMTPSIAPQGEQVNREPVRDTFSPLGHVITSKYNQLSIECELKGAGLDTGVQAPEFDVLLRSCGMTNDAGSLLNLDAGDDASAFTVGESVSNGSGVSGVVAQVVGTTGGSLVVVEISGGSFSDMDSLTGDDSGASGTVTGDPQTAPAYRPTSDPSAMTSATVYFHRDGILHKAVGCRGTASLNIQVGQIASISFELQALYAEPVDDSLPSPATVALQPPVANGLGLRVGGYEPGSLTQFSLSYNNDVARIPDLNAEEGISRIIINGRRPTGSVDPEADTLANFNPWNDWSQGNTAVLNGTVGASSGNRVGLFVPSAQYESVSYSDRDGMVAYDLPFVCRQRDASDLTSGDDEAWIIFS